MVVLSEINLDSGPVALGKALAGPSVVPYPSVGIFGIERS